MTEKVLTLCDNEVVTLAVAAKALGVTRRTVERWVEAGKLTKLKDGSKSCVRMSDVRKLRAEMNGKLNDPERTGEEDIMLSRSRFEELISENAALKRQAEFLLEDLTLKEAREKDLDDARRKILEQERIIGQLEGRLQVLDTAKKPFWRRWFSRRG